MWDSASLPTFLDAPLFFRFRAGVWLRVHAEIDARSTHGSRRLKTQIGKRFALVKRPLPLFLMKLRTAARRRSYAAFLSRQVISFRSCTKLFFMFSAFIL